MPEKKTLRSDTTSGTNKVTRSISVSQRPIAVIAARRPSLSIASLRLTYFTCTFPISNVMNNHYLITDIASRVNNNLPRVHTTIVRGCKFREITQQRNSHTTTPHQSSGHTNLEFMLS